jgi:hypothetical protein
MKAYNRLFKSNNSAGSIVIAERVNCRRKTVMVLCTVYSVFVVTVWRAWRTVFEEYLHSMRRY